MSEVSDIEIGDLVDAFEATQSPSGEELQWVTQPTHYPKKRLITWYSVELSDPTLRISTRPAPFKNTLN